jgi:hypothetical protein
MMNASSKTFAWFAGLPIVVCAICLLAPLSGQEAKPKAKAKGRLPPYYTQVVDAKQREQIYAIQAKYKEQIEKLQAELKAATEKQDAEIEALLSAEQKDKVAKLRAEGKSKGKGNAAEPNKAGGKDDAKAQ